MNLWQNNQYCKLRICPQRLQLVLPRAGWWRPCLGVFWPAHCPSFSSGSLRCWLFVCHFDCYHFQGRPDFVLPAFVSTFAMTALLSLSGISLLTQTPILHQLLSLGPGFSPVPAKLVSQIVAKEFVELNELLNEPKPQLRFDGRLVLTSTPKKFKWQVDDITSWLEAFQCIALFYPPISCITGSICCTIRYPLDSLAVCWPGLVSVRSGFLRTCCCNEPHRLVNH